MEIKIIPHSGAKYLKFSSKEIEDAKIKLANLTEVERVLYYHNPHSIKNESYNKGKRFEDFVYWESEVSSVINPFNGKKGEGYKHISFCPRKID